MESPWLTAATLSQTWNCLVCFQVGREQVQLMIQSSASAPEEVPLVYRYAGEGTKVKAGSVLHLICNLVWVYMGAEGLP